MPVEWVREHCMQALCVCVFHFPSKKRMFSQNNMIFFKELNKRVAKSYVLPAEVAKAKKGHGIVPLIVVGFLVECMPLSAEGVRCSFAVLGRLASGRFARE